MSKSTRTTKAVQLPANAVDFRLYAARRLQAELNAAPGSIMTTLVVRETLRRMNADESGPRAFELRSPSEVTAAMYGMLRGAVAELRKEVLHRVSGAEVA